MLVEQGIGNKRNGFPRLGVVVIVGNDAVTPRLDPGDQGGVVRPGHRRKGALHPLRPRAVRRQGTNRRHVRLGVVEIIRRQAIDADENDVTVLARGLRGDKGEGKGQEKKEACFHVIGFFDAAWAELFNAI